MATQSGSSTKFRPIGVLNAAYNSTNLGYSKGDIQLKIEKVDDYNREIDAYVGSPVGRFSGGRKLSLMYPMLESDITKLALVMPDGTEESDTFTFGEQAGEVITGYELVLTPKSSDDLGLTVYSAVPTVNLDWIYNHKTEKVVPVLFDAMYDLTRSEGDMLYKITGSFT